MSFLQNLRVRFMRFMQGRHGIDQLGIFTLFAGLILSVISSLFGSSILSVFGMLLYIFTIFRMFSKNNVARYAENQKYMVLSSKIKTNVSQQIKRLKNSKQYKYFRCPKCKVLLRLTRGCGKKTIICPKCKHEFQQKA